MIPMNYLPCALFILTMVYERPIAEVTRSDRLGNFNLISSMARLISSDDHVRHHHRHRRRRGIHRRHRHDVHRRHRHRLREDELR